MEEFLYTVCGIEGIHARPAGQLAKKAAQYKSCVTIEKDGREATTSRLMALMGLDIRCGDSIKIKVEGSDEHTAADGIKRFMTEHSI